jgi:hypothetical protein
MADDGVGFSRWMTLSNKERAAGGDSLSSVASTGRNAQFLHHDRCRQFADPKRFTCATVFPVPVQGRPIRGNIRTALARGVLVTELNRKVWRAERAVGTGPLDTGLLLGFAHRCRACQHHRSIRRTARPVHLHARAGINAANAAHGVDPASYGSSAPAGNCAGAGAGGSTIIIVIPTVTLTTIDNYWYGANALPPIASPMIIAGADQLPTTLHAVHAGDPTPTTANAFRFFYVSGGMELPEGFLFLANVVKAAMPRAVTRVPGAAAPAWVARSSIRASCRSRMCR